MNIRNGAYGLLHRAWWAVRTSLTAGLGLLIIGCMQIVAAQSASPNVLLVIIDDLNDWIGALGGHPQAVTPRIDTLAAQGVLFTNAHAAGPICHPSRASLMTGISPARSGIKTNAEQPWRDYLPNAVSMNQAFRDAGYETVGYGKVYHGNEQNHDLPNWDIRIPRPSSAEPPADEIPINGLDQIDRGGPGGGDWGIVDQPASEFEDHKVTTWAVDYINGRDINNPQPFFLAVGLRSTHSPWYFPPAYFDRIAGGITDDVLPPETLNNDLSDVGTVAQQWAAADIWAPLINDAAKVREGVHSYLAGAAFADDQVGRMLDALDASGLADNTIIVVVSDHGYHLSEKQTWQKQSLWEEDTRVPLIFRVPASLLSTQVPQVDEPASISAIFPTLLELTGIAMPGYAQGDPLYRVDYRSLVPLLDGSTTGNWAGPAVTYGRGEDATIRTGERRFTYYRDQFTELYDKLVDSEEWFNVSDSAQYQDEVPLWTSDALRYLAGQHAPFGYRETCGPPQFDPSQDFGIHVWRDCDGPNPDIWRVRVTGGNVVSEQTFAGEITSDAGFDTVNAVSLEANDSLNNAIQFDFRVVGSDEDGVDFSYPTGAEACLTIPTLPSGAEIFVGETRFPVTLPFNPDTLAFCGPPIPTGEIGDFVWQDLDGDGIQGQSEPGFSGANVRLLDCNDNELAATTTDANGSYLFQQLAVGSYRIRFVAPPGYELSPRKVAAGNGGNDSNPDPATGLSNCLSIADGQSRIGIDAGLVDLGGVLPDLSISDASANEDTGILTFNVSLTSATAENVTFSVSTADGTATVADNDYVALSNSPVLITAGATSTTVDIALTPDSVVEANETLSVTVSNVSANVNVADSTATGTILNDDDSGGSGSVPLESWTSATGGVSVSGNQISYSGSPTGWFQNTVNSQPLSSLGFTNNFEVRWTIDTDPTNTLWIVGLGTVESGADWTDVEYGLRITNGSLDIRESGSWLAFGPALAQGDVISIYVSNGTIEYRHNDITIFSSTYTGTPDFYVDTSFKQGAIAFSVEIAGVPVVPPGNDDITDWVGQTGGVTVSGNTITYSGTPIGWQNTVNSVLLSSLGAGSDFTVGWTVQTSPVDTIWVVGLGLTETNVEAWRDVDFGIRSSGGSLNIRENGTWVKGGGALAVGDRLEIRVTGTTLEYLHNSVVVATSTITGTEDFYIDTAFKTGAIVLSSFTLTP